MRNSELGSAKIIQKLGKVVLDGDNSHLNSVEKNDIIKNNEQETNNNIFVKETPNYVARKESRDAFTRMVHDENCKVGTRGEFTYAYRVCRSPSQKGKKIL